MVFSHRLGIGIDIDYCVQLSGGQVFARSARIQAVDRYWRSARPCSLLLHPPATGKLKEVYDSAAMLASCSRHTAVCRGGRHGRRCVACLLRTWEVWLVSQFAYLVIREGAKWSDVFRLMPGQSVTIGRAPTSQIVLNDERCSRNHVESVHVERAMDTPRPGKPQRHDRGQPDGPRRPAVEARRHHPHRPDAVGLRP